MKIPRLLKSKEIFESICGKEEEFYSDIIKLREILAKCMKQKKDNKTIVFALKMFHYAARIRF